ncbi:MAG: hypothetical protein MI861_25540, partial [Pirellulales bacterium]|nr:hypothetical protein [Pirellulales bacterium]
GRDDEAVQAAAKSLQMFVESEQLLNDLARYHRAEDIPLLLDVLTESRNREGWNDLMAATAGSTAWTRQLVDEVRKRSDLPAGILELTMGMLARSEGDFSSASKHFLKARDQATLATVRSTASQQHFQARIDGEEFAELFDEVDSFEETVEQLVQQAYDDMLYCDEEKLLAALDQPSVADNSAWVDGLRGWLHHGLQHPDKALEHSDRFLTWLAKNEDTLTEDQQWLIAPTEYYVADSLLKLGRPQEVLQKWPDDIQRHHQITNHLLKDLHGKTTEEFLQATSETPSEPIQLQRLRLQAAMASLAGDGTQSDRYHRQAFKLSSKVYADEPTYWTDRLIEARAGDLVLNRLAPNEVPLDAQTDEQIAQRDQLITKIAHQAASIEDGNLLQAWLDHAGELGIESGETYAAILDALGRYHQSRGDDELAFQTFQKCLEH